MKSKSNYKWVIVGLCFLMVMTCLGLCSSSKSLYLDAITNAIGVKRSIFSVSNSIRYVTTAIVNIFFGALVVKFGTKKLILAGISCLILSSLCYSFGDSLIWFYIAGALLGIGFSWTTTTMVGCVVNRWCSENKGTIMGAVLAANGLGGTGATWILLPIIESGVWGYRKAYLITTAILVFVLLLMIIFYKDRKDITIQKKKSKSTWDGIEISQARKKTYFYAALVCVFLTGMVLQGVTSVNKAHMKANGIEGEILATILSVHSITLAVSKFTTGITYDKFGLRTTVIICNISAIIAFVTLALASSTQTGIICAFIYSVFSSFALPLETIMLPIFAGDLFGAKSYDKILGIIVSVNTAGYAFGEPVLNIVYDLIGTYVPALIVLSVLMAVIMIVFQLVITSANKHKK